MAKVPLKRGWPLLCRSLLLPQQYVPSPGPSSACPSASLALGNGTRQYLPAPCTSASPPSLSFPFSLPSSPNHSPCPDPSERGCHRARLGKGGPIRRADHRSQDMASSVRNPVLMRSTFHLLVLLVLGGVGFGKGRSRGGAAVTSAQQVLRRPINFTLVPALSNWTWLAPNSSNSSYVSVTARPRSFGLQGYLSATVTGCSADPSSVNATQVTINGAQLLAGTSSSVPSLDVTSAGVGNITASLPTLNLTTLYPFNVEQRYGGYSPWWVGPTATWQNVTGYIESGNGFQGGPVSNANLSSGLGSFGEGSGYLTTQPSGRLSSLRLFLNSTFLLDPRQVLLAINASGSLLNTVFGQNAPRTFARIVLVADAPNPCTYYVAP